MSDMSASKIDSQFCMFVGTPGTRKSTQALSYPGPQYWLSWDQKMNSLLLPMRAWGIDPKTIHYDDFSDWNAGKAKLENLIAPHDQFSVEPCPYKTVVVDSITTMADSTLQQTLKLKYGTTRSSGKEAGKRVAGIAVNEIEDYNAEASALSELIALCKQLKALHNVNIILIAHLIQAEYKSITTGHSNIVRTIVTAGKRIAPKIPAYCEEVYHFFLKNTSMMASADAEYTILTSSTSEDFARTALPLDKEIIIGDNPLYTNYILPAKNKLNSTL